MKGYIKWLINQDGWLIKGWMAKSKMGCYVFQGMVVTKDVWLDLERPACYQHRVQCMCQLMEAGEGGARG